MTQEIFYKPHTVLCADGIERTARVRSYWDGRGWGMHADTAFSVPAYVKVKGRTVRGFVHSETRQGYQTATDNDPAVLKFSAYTYRKNHGLIVEAKQIAFDVEVTDTFSGEANYSWVRRGIIYVSEALPYASKAYRRAKVMAAKRFAGWTGQRCEVADYGDMLDIRPRNACVVCFVTYREE